MRNIRRQRVSIDPVELFPIHISSKMVKFLKE